MPGRTTTVTTRREGVTAFIWRHRVGLAPVLVAVGAALLTTVVKAVGAATYLVAVLFVLIGLAWLGANVQIMSESHEPKPHRKKEFNYHAVAATVTVAWMFWYWAVDGTWANLQAVFTVWLVALAVVGAPYWFNLRRRTKVRLDNMMEAWPKIAEGTSLAKTRWASFAKTANGWTGVLTWDKGALSRRRVQNEAELVESLVDAPPESVVIELVAGKGNANRVKVTCVEEDPHVEAIPFDGVVATSIKDKVNLGKYTDHAQEITRWWEPGVGGFHRLIGGATRSGKSGLMHLLVAKYAGAQDVAFWFADLKGGTALLPWSPVADWTETTDKRCLWMVQAAAQEVDRRARICASRGTEVWEPTTEEPVILLFFDEIASLIGDSAPNQIATAARSAMVEVARKGAGMGVLLVPATQYPTLAALGDSQLKSQLAWRACFRLNQPEQGHYILPSMPRTVDPYRIPKSRRGTCYIDAEGEFRPAMLRVQYVDRDDLEAVVERFSDDPLRLDGIESGWSREDLREAYRARKKWTRDDLRALREGASVAGSDADGDDLYDWNRASESPVEDAEDDAQDDVRDDSDDDIGGTVIPLNFGKDPRDDDNEIAQAVRDTHDADPQMARREAKEREAYLEARRPIPMNKVEAVMFKTLDEAGEAGVSPGELAAATGRTERTIHRYLERQKDRGVVIRVGYGRYRLTVTPVRH